MQAACKVLLNQWHFNHYIVLHHYMEECLTNVYTCVYMCIYIYPCVYIYIDRYGKNSVSIISTQIAYIVKNQCVIWQFPRGCVQR